MNPSCWGDIRLQDPDKNYPWDFRGIDRIFVAIAQHAPQVRSLYIGCDTSTLSPLMFVRPESAKALATIGPRLTHFKLNTSSLHGDPRTDFKTAIKKFLPQAKNLRSLILGFDTFETYWDDLFATAYLPRLETLDLGYLGFRSEGLQTMIRAHAQTLKHLSLYHAHLSTPKTWENLAVELRSLNPRFIYFYMASSGSDEVSEGCVCDILF